MDYTLDSARTQTSITVDQNDFRDPVSYGYFDPTTNPPATLLCGHTFAISTIENLKASGHYKCPACGASFPHDFEAKKNVILTSLLKNKRTFDTCPYHPDRKAKYVCLSDQILLCDRCLCEDKHVGHKKEPISDIMRELKSRNVELSSALKDVDLGVEKLLYFVETKIKQTMEEIEEKLRGMIKQDIESLISGINDWRLKQLGIQDKIEGFLDGTKPFTINLLEEKIDLEMLNKMQENFKSNTEEELKRVKIVVEPKVRELAFEKEFFSSLEKIQASIKQTTPTPDLDFDENSPEDANQDSIKPYEDCINKLKENIEKEKEKAEKAFAVLRESLSASDQQLAEFQIANEQLKRDNSNLEEEVNSLRLALKELYSEKDNQK